jgi:hypothetical protein
MIIAFGLILARWLMASSEDHGPRSTFLAAVRVRVDDKQGRRRPYHPEPDDVTPISLPYLFFWLLLLALLIILIVSVISAGRI